MIKDGKVQGASLRTSCQLWQFQKSLTCPMTLRRRRATDCKSQVPDHLENRSREVFQSDDQAKRIQARHRVTVCFSQVPQSRVTESEASELDYFWMPKREQQCAPSSSRCSESQAESWQPRAKLRVLVEAQWHTHSITSRASGKTSNTSEKHIDNCNDGAEDGLVHNFD